MPATERFYFVLEAADRRDAGGLRTKLGTANDDWLLRAPTWGVGILHGGPLLDEACAPNGTVLVMQAGSIDDVRAFVAESPYLRAGLYQSIAVRPLAWGGSQGQPSPGTG